jgi:hypothetical protein
MSKVAKSAVPAAILVAGMFWVSATPIYATAAYAKAEGKACTYCHVKNGEAALNAAGKYYGEHDHSLKGYKPAK